MQIVSTNIGQTQTITWKNKKLETGFYKNPVNEAIFLGKNGVSNDKVVDTRFHGGIDKACYLFSEKHYDYWKTLYPDLDWKWGMFGENLTISGLDESELRVGDVFQIGAALVQATQARQPCFKLGIRFNNQQIVKQFIDYQYSGVYVRVINEGFVKNGDKLHMVEQNKNGLTIKEIFRLLYSKEDDLVKARIAINDKYLADSCRKDLMKHFNL